MAAPERFAERSDSSCTAGAVHTWPLATDRIFMADGRFGCEADMAGPATGSTRSLVTQSGSSVNRKLTQAQTRLDRSDGRITL